MIPTGSKDPTDVVGRRIFAFVLDAVLITAVVVIVGALVAKRYTNAPSDCVRDTAGANDRHELRADRLTCVHGLVVADGTLVLRGTRGDVLDFVILPGVTGASIGKLMLGLRRRRRRRHGVPVRKALGRTVLLVVDLFFLIGLFVMIGSKPHRRIGDNAAGTYVVDVASVGMPVIGVASPMPEYTYAEQPAWGSQQPAWGAQPPPPAWGASPAATATARMGRTGRATAGVGCTAAATASRTAASPCGAAGARAAYRRLRPNPRRPRAGTTGRAEVRRIVVGHRARR